MKEQVAGFLFSDDLQRVVLIQKNRPEWQAGRFNGIGGHVDVEQEEYPVDAMRREFREETGLDVERWSIFCTLGDQRGWSVRFFMAVGDVDQCRSTTDEQVFVFPVAKLPESVLPNLRWLIPMALSMPLERCDEFVIREYKRGE